MPPKRRSSSRGGSRARSRSRKTSRSRSPARPKHAANHVPTPVSTPEEAYYVTVERKFTPEKDDWHGNWEFNGPLGAAGIMIASHVLIFYFFVCIEKFQGTIIYPGHKMLNGEPMQRVFFSYLAEHACPTVKTMGIFLGFLFLEYVLALILPAMYVKGLPLPSENGYRLTYKCNAVGAWYCMLIIVGLLHYFGIFPLYELRRDYGHYLTAATIVADVISVWVFIAGWKRRIRMTGSTIYDFFMGSGLNFRLPGNIDVKLFAECRNSWVLLMMLTLSCAAEQYEELHYLTGNMIFMIVAHLLYVNAIQKGEECVISTWDIYYEKFGWMLAFWNTCGVPFLYCMQSLYIQTVLKDKQYPIWVLVLMGCILFAAYYVWDTINSQKNRFRMRRSGVPMEIIRNRAFPQLPWRYIENPRTLKSEKGELFVDGFYRYGRKLHYTVDLVMAFLWGSACGFSSFVPFFYFFFFLGHLIDRERRDEHRCKTKYGTLWDEYVKEVPYKFIPYVY
ncbi:putative mitochondrial sterol C-24 reductase [Leptomonas pyrrhocoris]|uniref:Delta(24(24(1)))-sterol reductase n=1 Tax=Leptomonas pyrrhocoris TaxID=157538 RepID=A0A0N0DT09_LEPPY|nr:putative mitochondrial sterol C-24 reductase [Leptomonas pyrrhocoris]KPA76734.1 putative mitochondrial sterol C-24 reductase [Leptomonas pyrrhocoris]|eukprot:XP_015655173.1 putative mitochondrial sterol C-24 reductase [Leptomonas pyrrhocoris]